MKGLNSFIIACTTLAGLNAFAVDAIESTIIRNQINEVVDAVQMKKCDSCEKAALAAEQSGNSAKPAPTGCVIENDGGTVKPTQASLAKCLGIARVLLDQPELTLEDIIVGQPGSFPGDEPVHCKLRPTAAKEVSKKFRCMRTDAKGALLDKDGKAIAGAVDFDEEGILLGADKKPVLTAKGKTIKGDELRVKYFENSTTNADPEPRMREMFTETFASRFYWALGVPVDRTSMPSEVICEGCNKSPFGQSKKVAATETFKFASVKHKLSGKKMEIASGSTDFSFAFGDLTRVAATWTPEKRAELEALAVFHNLMGYHNFADHQNGMVCPKGKYDETTGDCQQAIPYISDVGSTLGKDTPALMTIFGGGKNPRGDYEVFSKETAKGLFKSATGCQLANPMGSIITISEAGRREAVRRLSALDREKLVAMFAVSNFQRIKASTTQTLVAQFRAKYPDQDLGPATEQVAVANAWADLMEKRINDVKNRTCN